MTELMQIFNSKREEIARFVRVDGDVRSLWSVEDGLFYSLKIWLERGFDCWIWTDESIPRLQFIKPNDWRFLERLRRYIQEQTGLLVFTCVSLHECQPIEQENK